MIERQDIEALFNKLEAQGFHVQVAISLPDMTESHPLTIDDIIACVQDRDAFFEKACGLPLQVIRDWHSADQLVLCAGLKKNGRPCRATVKGGYTNSPQEWYEMQGTLCEIHKE